MSVSVFKVRIKERSRKKLKNNIMNEKLKPVIFANTRYDKYRQNTTQQIMLLKAMKVTQDPEKLRQMAGLRSVAEVFRTLDKMAMRKEYHKALAKSGIDFGFIIEGIKAECLNGDKSADRLNGYKVLLKSLGMDSYQETTEGAGGGWEEALRAVSENNEKRLEAPKSENEDYEVKRPDFSEDEVIREEKGLYD